MIEITRDLARQVRAVFRKATKSSVGRPIHAPILLHAGPDGLRVRMHHDEVAVDYHEPGQRPTDSLALPLDGFQDFEGKTTAPVILEKIRSGMTQGRWDDDGLPQVRDYGAKESKTPIAWPELPAQFVAVDASLLNALVEASRTAAREKTRFAVTRIHLGGKAGEVAATDLKQLLIQSGFSFPWSENVLIPSPWCQALRELPQREPVTIGKTDTHVGLRVGPWTFLLAIDQQGRLPPWESLIRRRTNKMSILRLNPQDAVILAKSLAKLPGRKDPEASLTVDLNGHAAIRVKPDGRKRITEVTLNHSEAAGPPVRLSVSPHPWAFWPAPRSSWRPLPHGCITVCCRR